jgi:hypothetical protein
MTYTFKTARSAETGKFVPMTDAKRRPSQTVVETMKVVTKPSR